MGVHAQSLSRAKPRILFIFMLCVSQAMFGWLGSHASGLLADEQALIDGAGLPGEVSIEDSYASQSGQLSLCHACNV